MEKAQNQGKPTHTFDELFELSLQFLSNPHKIWASGHDQLRKLVLRLAFAERIEYNVKTGNLNPKFSLPFNMLESFRTPKLDMVLRAGLEPARLAPLPPQDSVSTNSTT